MCERIDELAERVALLHAYHEPKPVSVHVVESVLPPLDDPVPTTILATPAIPPA